MKHRALVKEIIPPPPPHTILPLKYSSPFYNLGKVRPILDIHLAIIAILRQVTFQQKCALVLWTRFVTFTRFSPRSLLNLQLYMWLQNRCQTHRYSQNLLLHIFKCKMCSKHYNIYHRSKYSTFFQGTSFRLIPHKHFGVQYHIVILGRSKSWNYLGFLLISQMNR